MEETKHETPHADSEDTGTQKRDAEATSDATLEDIEESTKVSTSGSTSSSSSDLEGASPKPDGGEGGRADGSDTGGPM